MTINDELMMRNGRTQAENMEFGALTLSEHGWYRVLAWVADATKADLWQVAELALTGSWSSPHRTRAAAVSVIGTALKTPRDHVKARGIAELNRRALLLDALYSRGIIASGASFASSDETGAARIVRLLKTPELTRARNDG